MIALDDCSAIGFGGYRVSILNKDHINAFRLAINLGCNLVDTSSNYTNGDSEKLIGHFVKENPDKALFIVTKGGYIQGDLIAKAVALRQKANLTNYTVINEDFHYSISPKFLDTQIKQSLNRLNRSWLDGYLLHNPEYLLHAEIEDSELI